jgi:hypothetical protein
MIIPQEMDKWVNVNLICGMIPELIRAFEHLATTMSFWENIEGPVLVYRCFLIYLLGCKICKATPLNQPTSGKRTSTIGNCMT